MLLDTKYAITAVRSGCDLHIARMYLVRHGTSTSLSYACREPVHQPPNCRHDSFLVQTWTRNDKMQAGPVEMAVAKRTYYNVSAVANHTTKVKIWLSAR